MDKAKMERMDRRYGHSIDLLFRQEEQLPRDLEKLEAGRLKYEYDPLDSMFGPERCPECGEALTPKTLKLREGGRPQIQCRCDAGWGKKEKD